MRPRSASTWGSALLLLWGIKLQFLVGNRHIDGWVISRRILGAEGIELLLAIDPPHEESRLVDPDCHGGVGEFSLNAGAVNLTELGILASLRLRHVRQAPAADL